MIPVNPNQVERITEQLLGLLNRAYPAPSGNGWSSGPLDLLWIQLHRDGSGGVVRRADDEDIVECSFRNVHELVTHLQEKAGEQ